MNLTIHGYSTALFSTWYFIEELALLFDCGDGFSAAMLQKSRKVENVFISHADRDHLAGLLQFNQLNARQTYPKIYYPKHCGSFPALENFSQKFDPNTKDLVWNKVDDKDRIWIRKDIYIEALRNNHVLCDNEVIKSLGYSVVQVKYKLKTDFINLSPQEIKENIERLGKEKTHDELKTILLSYSGDTPCENFKHWNHSKILIHEATFLNEEENESIKKHGNKHSTLKDVMKAVAEQEIECLILGHFSSRYSIEQIDDKIREYRKHYNLSIPIFRVAPGMVHYNILGSEPM